MYHDLMPYVLYYTCVARADLLVSYKQVGYKYKYGYKAIPITYPLLNG
jgi:hypothetical protein